MCYNYNMTDYLSNFFFGPVLIWSPAIFSFLIMSAAATLYFPRIRSNAKIFKFVNYKFLIIYLLAFKVFYAVILTVSQYLVWSNNDFTKYFLPPYQTFDYFILYSCGRFWMALVISFGVSLIFWFCLKAIKKYRPFFFGEGELELGLICALVSGWPNFVVFLPLAFSLIFVFSFFRILFFKKDAVAIGPYFLIASFISLFIGAWLIDIFNLNVLMV